MSDMGSVNLVLTGVNLERARSLRSDVEKKETRNEGEAPCGCVQEGIYTLPYFSQHESTVKLIYTQRRDDASSLKLISCFHEHHRRHPGLFTCFFFSHGTRRVYLAAEERMILMYFR